MGSTNTGRFTDYPKPLRPTDQAGGGTSASPGGGGGGDARDPCATVIEHEVLEEVARCEYFERHGEVPPVGTDVRVLADLVGGRLAVATRAEGIVIGLLATRWNLLLACMNDGWRYEGEVVAAIREHVPTIRVELRPAR
jgi:hypothetical protein